MVHKGAPTGAITSVEQAGGQQQGIGQVLQLCWQVTALAGLVQQAGGGLLQVGALHGLVGVARCLQTGAQRAISAHMLVHVFADATE